MAFHPILQRKVAPVTVTLLAGGIALYPRQIAYAESPERRKPIYEDYPSLPNTSKPQIAYSHTKKSTEAISPPSAPPSGGSTPTDILTIQVRKARLGLYDVSLKAENQVNNYLSRLFHIEHAFTNTIASLAPSPESGERLLPGSIYVLVSAMAGSIVSRNRGIFLRTTTPLTLGTVAAWTLLPVTMRNISDLIWDYEEKAPALADAHLRIRNRIEYTWATSVAHTQMARSMLEEKIGEGRGKLEELIKQRR